ncbi:MAG: hypothetical protein NVV62_08915 [Terricaulis sp.]|nr:hypothetical protein [Terricaulis sp.]
MGQPPRPPRPLPDFIQVCGPCSEKLNGAGFGPGGEMALIELLRRELGLAAAGVEVRESACMHRCPWRAVTVLRGGRPAKVALVSAGASSAEVAAQLRLPAPAGGA